MRVSQERDPEHDGASFSCFSPRHDGLGETSGRLRGIRNREPRRLVGPRERGQLAPKRDAFRARASGAAQRATLHPVVSEA